MSGKCWQSEEEGHQSQTAIFWAMDSPECSVGEMPISLLSTISVFNSRQRRHVQVGGRGLSSAPLLLLLLVLLVLFSPGLTN